jgi:hypothetical protein
MPYGITVELTHAGLSTDSILLTDIRECTDGLTGYRKAGPVYVPVGGSVTLVYSGDVAKSFEAGNIRGFITNGHLTGALNLPDGVTVVGKLNVTGVIDPTAIVLSDPDAGTELYFESADGQTAPVSDAGKARLRYNDASKVWEQSIDGGAYEVAGPYLPPTEGYVHHGTAYPARGVYDSIQAAIADGRTVIRLAASTTPYPLVGESSGIIDDSIIRITTEIQMQATVELEGVFPDAAANTRITFENIYVDSTGAVDFGANRSWELFNGSWIIHDLEVRTDNSYNLARNSDIIFPRFTSESGGYNAYDYRAVTITHRGDRAAHDVCSGIYAYGLIVDLQGSGANMSLMAPDGVVAADCAFAGTQVYANANANDLTVVNAGTGGTIAVWGSILTQKVTTGSVTFKNAAASYVGAVGLTIQP